MSNANTETQVFYLMLTAYSADIEPKLVALLLQHGYTVKAASPNNTTCWTRPFSSFIWLHLTRQIIASDNACLTIRTEVADLLTKAKIAYMNFIITKPTSGAAISLGPDLFKKPIQDGGPKIQITLVDPDTKEESNPEPTVTEDKKPE